MACYLMVSEESRECEGCGVELPPGVVGLTDELTGALVAQCRTCLFSLDRRLAAAWITSIAGLNLEMFDQVIERLLQLDEFADLATPKKPN